MRVFGTWCGGTHCGTGDIFSDMETWRSLRAARLGLWLRADSGSYPVDDGACGVTFADDGLASVGEATGALIYPLVEAAETQILLYGATVNGGRWSVDIGYPILRLHLGPRGGLRTERL